MGPDPWPIHPARPRPWAAALDHPRRPTLQSKEMGSSMCCGWQDNDQQLESGSSVDGGMETSDDGTGGSVERATPCSNVTRSSSAGAAALDKVSIRVRSHLCQLLIEKTCLQCFWHCQLGARKSIRPVKNWMMLCWRGYLSGARCKWCSPASATATASSLASVKSGMVFTFLVLAYSGCLGK